MSLEALRRALPPPATPTAAPSAADWERFEAGPDGIALPEDYKAFLSCYGCGILYGMNRAHDLMLWSPFACADQWRGALERELAFARKIRAVAPGDYGSHSIYPERGGLLPFAHTGNAQTLFWRTAGTPEQWTVVACKRAEPPWDHPENTTAFLHRLVTQRGYCPRLTGYASKNAFFWSASVMTAIERLPTRPTPKLRPGDDPWASSS